MAGSLFRKSPERKSALVARITTAAIVSLLGMSAAAYGTEETDFQTGHDATAKIIELARPSLPAADADDQAAAPEAQLPVNQLGEVKPYIVENGVAIPASLAQDDWEASAARGAVVFASSELGACNACHTVDGVEPAAVGPQMLAARLAAVPFEPAHLKPDPQIFVKTDGVADPKGGFDPLLVPEPPVSREIGRIQAQAQALELEKAAARANAPVQMVLAQGRDLSNIGNEMSAAQLRLVIVNPRLRQPQSPMPAYYNLSVPLAQANPSLRQPWLTPEQIEDLVAYLSTLKSGEEVAEIGKQAFAGNVQ